MSTLNLLKFSTADEYDSFLATLSVEQVERIRNWLDPAAFLGFVASQRRLTDEDKLAICHAAADPHLDGDVLASLYKYALQFPEPSAAVQVVTHPNLPVAILQEAAALWRRQVWVEKKGYSETLSAVALANVSLTDPAELFRENIKETQWLAASPSPPHSAISSSFSPPRRRRRKPEGWLNEDLYINSILHPQIPSSSEVLTVLMELSTQQSLMSGYNPYEWIPEGILNHPNCGGNALTVLYSAWVTHEESRTSHIISSPLQRLVLLALEKEECPPSVLSQACWSENIKVRHAAAQHPACPEEDAVAAVLLPGGNGNLLF